jgi:hypothetical protein
MTMVGWGGDWAVIVTGPAMSTVARETNCHDLFFMKRSFFFCSLILKSAQQLRCAGAG